METKWGSVRSPRSYISGIQDKILVAWHDRPEHRDDRLLESEWIRTKRSADIAFRSGATDEYVPRNSPEPAPQTREFTFATWNIRQLSDGDLEEKAHVIREMGADIVALQEVDDLPKLEKFQKQYLHDAYPHQILIEGNDEFYHEETGVWSKRNVALLSKFPIRQCYTYRDHPMRTREGHTTYFERDLLEAVVDITPNFSMKVFVTHLKSKRGGNDATIRREAEAAEIRKIILQHLKENPNDLILLAGDFNDTPNSGTVRKLDQNSYPLIDPLRKEGKGCQPTENSKSYGKSRFDYALISPALMKRYVIGSGRIVRGDKKHPASDHSPIFLKFRAA